MSRPLLEVADLIPAAGTAFIERNREWIRWTHIKVLLAIARCRTAALGGHIDECSRCGHRATISYNSCRNRHCPKCQTVCCVHRHDSQEIGMFTRSQIICKSLTSA